MPEGVPTGAPMSLSGVDEEQLGALMASMSLREKVGQMFQINWRALRPTKGCTQHVMRMVVTKHVRAFPQFHNDARPLSSESAQPLAARAVGSVLGDGGAAPTPNSASAWAEQNAAMQANAELAR